MRFIHTADWHLGRLFHGLHLTDDQSYILNDFVKLVADQEADAVIIAGDIYDRSVPPASAVLLLDEVLTKIAGELDIPVIVIAGNHDSPYRLSFGSRLFRNHNLTVVGPLELEQKPVLIRDKHGLVALHCLPFSEPGYARQLLQDPGIRDQDSAVSALIKALHLKGSNLRSIFVGHLHAEGGRVSESERSLSLWDDGRVKLGHFRDFNYVALGHLHCPQVLDNGRVHYPGSLLKYSFGEANETKGISVVEMDKDGRCVVERIQLAARRDVSCLEALFEDLIKLGEAGQQRLDYLKISLLDKGPVLDAMTRLREYFPHLLHIERPKLSFIPDGQSPKKEACHKALNESDLFCHFFKDVTGENMSDEERTLFRSLMGRKKSEQRELIS
jgi:DNA repair protein SbcD/Mre11